LLAQYRSQNIFYEFISVGSPKFPAGRAKTGLEEGSPVINGNANQSGSQRGHRLHSERKALVFELSVFLFLIVPSMALSFLVVKKGVLSFSLTAWATILRDFALVSLILYFLWQNGEPIRILGWTFKNIWRDIGIGIGLFIPFYFGTGLLENSLHAAGFSVPSTPLPSYLRPMDIPQIALAVFLVSIVAVAEETIFRGYLILRFKTLSTSSAVAVVIAAFIFSLGHGYEGSAGVVTVGVIGLVFGIIYLWRRSLVTTIVMHFMLDFIGIVVAPVIHIK
jgi:membrane protease YdiL (CAAX protease family)